MENFFFKWVKTIVVNQIVIKFFGKLWSLAASLTVNLRPNFQIIGVCTSATSAGKQVGFFTLIHDGLNCINHSQRDDIAVHACHSNFLWVGVKSFKELYFLLHLSINSLYTTLLNALVL